MNNDQYLTKSGLRLYDELIKQYIGTQGEIFYDTTANWNSKPSLIGKKGCVYIYSDYKKNAQNQDIAGVKIGDGLAYLIDSPFISEILYDHVDNKVIHISQNEREFWNAKVRCQIDPEDEQRIIFTTN